MDNEPQRWKVNVGLEVEVEASNEDDAQRRARELTNLVAPGSDEVKLTFIAAWRLPSDKAETGGTR